MLSYITQNTTLTSKLTRDSNERDTHIIEYKGVVDTLSCNMPMAT